MSFLLNRKHPLHLSQLNIDELISLCKQKNQRAESEIYNRYCKAMYNVAYRIVKDEHYAEDVMQEGFLKAFTRIHDYRQEVAYGAWLKRIIINHSIDFYKKNSAFQLEELDCVVYQVEEDYSIPNEIDFRDLKVAQILQAIQSLKENYSMILTLYFIEGYDQEEITEILKISNANCRTTLSRAKESLRKSLLSIN